MGSQRLGHDLVTEQQQKFVSTQYINHNSLETCVIMCASVCVCVVEMKT